MAASASGQKTRLSLFVKFALFSAFLITIVSGSTTILLETYYRAVRKSEIHRSDRALVQMLASLRTPAGTPDLRTLDRFVQSADKVDSGLVYALLIDARGTLLDGALNPRIFSQIDPGYEKTIRTGRQQVLQRLARGKIDRSGRIKEYPVTIDRGELRFGFDVRRIDRSVKQNQRVALAIVGIGLLLGILGSLLLARQLARPIKRLAQAMEAVASGNLDQSVRVRSNDEVGSLARSFNQMTESFRDHGMREKSITPYLSSAVMARINKEERPLEMGAEESSATVLSLRFLAPANIAARPLLSLLNDYLAGIIDALDHEGGTIVSLDHVHVRATWGAVSNHSEPELSAARAALAVTQFIEDETRRKRTAGLALLEAKIGISSGRVVAGNIGSARRVTFDVLGDAVRIADLAAQTASAGQALLTELATTKIKEQIETNHAPPLILEHQDEAIALYQLVGLRAN